MTFDEAHYPDQAAHDADRLLDEQAERDERADRFAEMGPANDTARPLTEREFWVALDAARRSKLARQED